jgi:putative spermidine/putrescine transport system permease protein
LPLRFVTFAVAGAFLLFLVLFEVLPGAFLVARAFTSQSGFTLEHLQEATKPLFLRALGNSVTLSLQSMLEGAILGTLTAGALWSSRNARVRAFVSALSGVAANFAGVPLAFAFVVMLGASGVLNAVFTGLGLPTVDIYNRANLHWVYLYFQWPLMTALMLPAFNAIDLTWLEASRGLGASSVVFWWRVGVPVLLPTLLGSSVLLFANSFGAYATVYALSQGSINLLPTQIGFQVSGQVGYEPGAAAALSLMMAAVLLLSLALYRASQVWAARVQGSRA